jgi:hypothetical protein
MRDWILVVAPSVTVIYFVIYPHQLAVWLYWIANVVR